MDEITKLALKAKSINLKTIISPEDVIVFLLTTNIFEQYINRTVNTQFMFELPISLLCPLGKIWYKRPKVGFAFMKTKSSEFKFKTEYFPTHEQAVEHFINAIIKQYG